MTNETTMEPRQPRRFEKKKNMGPGCPALGADMPTIEPGARLYANGL
jgi:hypothetical protein